MRHALATCRGVCRVMFKYSPASIWLGQLTRSQSRNAQVLGRAWTQASCRIKAQFGGQCLLQPRSYDKQAIELTYCVARAMLKHSPASVGRACRAPHGFCLHGAQWVRIQFVFLLASPNSHQTRSLERPWNLLYREWRQPCKTLATL